MEAVTVDSEDRVIVPSIGTGMMAPPLEDLKDQGQIVMVKLYVVTNLIPHNQLTLMLFPDNTFIYLFSIWQHIYLSVY